jgi:hypothetical protein
MVGGAVFWGCTITPMTPHHPTPDKDAIALLPPFERLGLDRISLIKPKSQALRVLGWGF